MFISFVRAQSRQRRPPAGKTRGSIGIATAAALTASLGACVLAPAGLREERDALGHSGEAYAAPSAERKLPELGAPLAWREILARALAANGDLEADYFQWKAALDRVTIVAGWPDTNVMPAVSYMLSGGGMKAWDRTTVNIGFDPMQNLSLPVKVRKAGEAALEEAREAGSRFAAAKFSLQRRTLESWLELTLLEERRRIQSERVELARLLTGSAAQRASVSGDQRDLLRTQVEQRMAELELEGLTAEARASRAMLNGLLAREPAAALDLEASLPKPRSLPDDDAALLAAGVENNPELRALEFTVSAREDALELARLRFLPDINPFAGFTGSISQVLGAGVSLPTRIPQIRAGIEEAGAMLRGARARLRQAELDRRGSFVAALYVLRFSERQLSLLMSDVRPAAEQIVGSVRQAYATGVASFDELIDAQHLLLDVRLAIAEAQVERERRIAEIEQLAGFDIETLSSAPLRALGEPPARAPGKQEQDHHE